MKDELQKHVETCFEEALKRVFETMLSSSVSIREIGPSDLDGSDILSSLVMNSSRSRGVFAVAFPASTFLLLVESLLGERHEVVDDQIADAASELLNMIYASARVAINSTGMDFQPAIPTVTCGKELRVHHPAGSSIRKFQCESPLGRFKLEWSLGGRT